MYDLSIIPILISYNFYNSKKYVLSNEENKLIFPLINCDNINNIREVLNKYLLECFFDTLEAKPYINNIKFIDINNEATNNIYDTDKTIYMIFGTTLPKLNIKKHFWTPFDFTDMNYANELTIIGKTIQYNV